MTFCLLKDLNFSCKLNQITDDFVKSALNIMWARTDLSRTPSVKKGESPRSYRLIFMQHSIYHLLDLMGQGLLLDPYYFLLLCSQHTVDKTILVKNRVSKMVILSLKLQAHILPVSW